MSKSTKRKRKIKADERAKLNKFFLVAAGCTAALLVLLYVLYN
ncbi:MAG: hypothetical protein AAGF87_17495 [Bacteroidota bacterium]